MDDSQEIEELILFQVTDCAAMRAGDVVSDDLKIWPRKDCALGCQKQISAELRSVCLLGSLIHLDVAIEHTSARARGYYAPAPSPLLIIADSPHRSNLWLVADHQQ